MKTIPLARRNLFHNRGRLCAALAGVVLPCFGQKDLVKWETPRLCRGDSQSLTVTETKESLSDVNCSKLHEREAIMKDEGSLSHTKWECKYHVVFIPKYRRKRLYGTLRRHLGAVLHELARRKECRIEEGNLSSDHVHMLVSIPPKYAVSQVVGFIKGKSAIHIARNYGERSRNFVGEHFWARGYYVSTVGRNERKIREYIAQQENEDRRLDQLLFDKLV